MLTSSDEITKPLNGKKRKSAESNGITNKTLMEKRRRRTLKAKRSYISDKRGQCPSRSEMTRQIHISRKEVMALLDNKKAKNLIEKAHISDDLVPALNYYFTNLLTTLLSQINIMLMKLGKYSKRVKGKDVKTSPTVRTQMLMHFFFTLLPAGVAKEVEALYHDVCKDYKDKKIFSETNMLSVRQHRLSFSMMVAQAQLSEYSGVLLSCFTTAIIRRILRQGWLAVSGKFNNGKRTPLKGMGRTLKPEHLIVGVEQDKPPHSRGAGLNHMFCASSVTQSHGLLYHRIETLNRPEEFEYYYPEYVKYEIETNS